MHEMSAVEIFCVLL